MPVEVTANRRGVFKFKGEARVNGVRCADATFSATSAPRES
jgi:3-hydroxyacyl-[acyl-carrier-protein] dehydratase